MGWGKVSSITVLSNASMKGAEPWCLRSTRSTVPRQPYRRALLERYAISDDDSDHLLTQHLKHTFSVRVRHIQRCQYNRGRKRERIHNSKSKQKQPGAGSFLGWRLEKEETERNCGWLGSCCRHNVLSTSKMRRCLHIAHCTR